MAVEIIHHEELWVDTSGHFVELDDVNGRIKEYDEFDAPENSPHDTLYAVDFEYQQHEEHYVVRTTDAHGTESRTYTIKQNDDGDWEVTKRVTDKSRTNHTSVAKGSGELSTRTVREALNEKYGIELVN